MSSPLTVNQMSLLANKFSAMGWDASRVTTLGQATPEQFRQLALVLDDRADVTEITRLGAITRTRMPETSLRHLKRFFTQENNPNGIRIGTSMDLFNCFCIKQPEYAVQSSAFVCSYADLVLPATAAQVEAELPGFTKWAPETRTAFACYIAELIDRHQSGTRDVFPEDGRPTIITCPSLVYGRSCISITFNEVEGTCTCSIQKIDHDRTSSFKKGCRVLMIEPA